MTALIVIGIVIAALVVHFTIGNIAALRIAPKIAELSFKTVTKEEQPIEYEWESNYSIAGKSGYNNVWYTESWKPKPTKKDMIWHKTGRTRGGEETTQLIFNKDKFKSEMNFVRWLWFIGLPVTMASSVDNKMIEKYDPSVAERKAKQQDNRIKELEKELQMEIES